MSVVVDGVEQPTLYKGLVSGGYAFVAEAITLPDGTELPLRSADGSEIGSAACPIEKHSCELVRTGTKVDVVVDGDKKASFESQNGEVPDEVRRTPFVRWREGDRLEGFLLTNADGTELGNSSCPLRDATPAPPTPAQHTCSLTLGYDQDGPGVQATVALVTVVVDGVEQRTRYKNLASKGFGFVPESISLDDGTTIALRSGDELGTAACPLEKHSCELVRTGNQVNVVVDGQVRKSFQSDNGEPPAEIVKTPFVHWLEDGRLEGFLLTNADGTSLGNPSCPLRDASPPSPSGPRCSVAIGYDQDGPGIQQTIAVVSVAVDGIEQGPRYKGLVNQGYGFVPETFTSNDGTPFGLRNASGSELGTAACPLVEHTCALVRNGATVDVVVDGETKQSFVSEGGAVPVEVQHTPFVRWVEDGRPQGFLLTNADGTELGNATCPLYVGSSY